MSADDPSTVVSLVSLAVSVAAVAYARSAASAAERQARAAENALRETQRQTAIASKDMEIARVQATLAIRQHQVSIYRSVLAAKPYIILTADFSQYREILDQMTREVDLAHLYFPEPTSNLLQSIVEDIAQVSILNSYIDSASDPDSESTAKLRTERYNRWLSFQPRLNEAVAAMRSAMNATNEA